MKNSLKSFEYDALYETIDFYCSYYNVKGKNFNKDFIFTIALNKFLKSVDRNKDYTEKQIRSYIKTIANSCVCDYIKTKKGDYKNTLDNISALKEEKFLTKIDTHDLFVNYEQNKTIKSVYNALNEKERALFDIVKALGDKKSKACKILNMSESEYDKILDKFYKLFKKLGIETLRK